MRAESQRHFYRICQLFPYGRILERSRFIRRSRQLIWLVQLIRQAMNKQLLPFESKNGNYEGEATQVLVLLSNYYADKKLFDENTDGYGNILILKDASIISKLSTIPDLLKGDLVDNNNIEYIKARNIWISSEVELESDVDGDKSDNLPVDIKILENRLEKGS